MEQQVSVQDLFAIIGDKEVQLAMVRGQLARLQSRITELEQQIASQTVTPPVTQ